MKYYTIVKIIILPVIWKYSDRTMMMQRIILIWQICLQCTSYILECRNNYYMLYFGTIIRIHSELLALSISSFLKKKILLFSFSSLGVVQGIITGVRGLCNGLGPALYGFIFFLFHVELNELLPDNTSEKKPKQNPSDKVSSKFAVQFSA